MLFEQLLGHVLMWWEIYKLIQIINKANIHTIVYISYLDYKDIKLLSKHDSKGDKVRFHKALVVDTDTKIRKSRLLIQDKDIKISYI